VSWKPLICLSLDLWEGLVASLWVKDSEVYNEIIQLGAPPVQALEFSENLPTYWGDQTFIGAPAYIGASILFLFVLALFLTEGKTKWWIIAGSILALLLSWEITFLY